MRLAVAAVASLLLVLSLFDPSLIIVAGSGVLAGLAIRWLWFRRDQAAQSIHRPATTTSAPHSARATAWPPRSTPTTAPNPPRRPASTRHEWTPKIVWAVIAFLILLALFALTREGGMLNPPRLPFTLAPRYEGTAILEGTEWVVTDRISFPPILLEQLNKRVTLDIRRVASLVHDLVSPFDLYVEETNGNLVLTPIGRQSQSELDATVNRIRLVLSGRGWLVRQQQQNILVTPTGVVSGQDVLVEQLTQEGWLDGWCSLTSCRGSAR
jgi:hypothetical protein